MRSRIRRRPLGLALIALLAIGAAGTAVAALQDQSRAKKPRVVIGRDDDNPDNGTIQSPGTGANQSLRKGDQILGGRAADTLIGRLGPDTLIGNAGYDVMVGGTERGSDIAEFPPFDVAFGNAGDDAFLWAPGDGSDAFDGAESRRVIKKKVRRKGKVRIKRILKPDNDVLIIGTMPVVADGSRPQLFQTKFGRLPRIFASNRGLPADIGDGNAPVPVFCEVVRAPVGLGYQYLVRVFVESSGNLAVTIRTKSVERVLCKTQGQDGISLTTLGPKGDGPVRIKSQDFRPAQGTKLRALVR
jgi:hypothetical protein